MNSNPWKPVVFTIHFLTCADFFSQNYTVKLCIKYERCAVIQKIMHCFLKVWHSQKNLSGIVGSDVPDKSHLWFAFSKCSVSEFFKSTQLTVFKYIYKETLVFFRSQASCFHSKIQNSHKLNRCRRKISNGRPFPEFITSGSHIEISINSTISISNKNRTSCYIWNQFFPEFC